ncbi:MAG TPA: S41 family peptidase [Chthoniobacterales bacterium]
MKHGQFFRAWMGLQLLLGGTLLFSLAAAPVANDLAEATLLFSRVLQIVRQDYVDPEKTNYRDLIYASLRGMLRTLDPHCEFFDPEGYKQEKYESEGETSGLGIVVAQVSGVFTVVSSMDNAPATQAGVRAGDQITAVNDVPTRGLTFDKLGRLLSGEPGQMVKLDLLRAGSSQRLQLSIKREIVHTSSIRDARLISTETPAAAKVGYLRVTEFVAHTADEIGRKLEEFKQAGASAFILDLRFNPGGLVRSAVDTSALFLPGKTLVVATEGRSGSNRQDLSTPDRDGPFAVLPMAILVNGETASAAEIVTGALKDANRAVVVGETTFGKGVIQSEVPLPDGAAIKFTTAEYFTPRHNAIEQRGIVPNIMATFSLDEARAFLLQDRRAYLNAEEKALVDHFKDEPLDRAVDALRAYLAYK